MVKNIVKGERIFSKKAQPATEADKQVITCLLYTSVRTQTLTTKPMMRHGRKHKIRSKTNMPMPKKSTN